LAGPLESNFRFKPSAAVGYKYRLDRVVSLGATFAYAGNTADSEFIWDNDSQPTHLNRDYYTLAAEAEFRWLTREHVTLYSMVGLGAAHQRTVRTTDTGEGDTLGETILTTHISQIGVKAGGHRFGGYLELGFGYKGIVNLGAYVRF
jgi:opacity protein-like surface antigen